VCGIRAGSGPLAGGLEGAEVKTVQHKPQPFLTAFFFCLFVSKGFWSLIKSKFLALKVTGDVGKVGGVEQCWANKVLTQGETGLSTPQQI